MQNMNTVTYWTTQVCYMWEWTQPVDIVDCSLECYKPGPGFNSLPANVSQDRGKSRRMTSENTVLFQINTCRLMVPNLYQNQFWMSSMESHTIHLKTSLTKNNRAIIPTYFKKYNAVPKQSETSQCIPKCQSWKCCHISQNVFVKFE